MFGGFPLTICWEHEAPELGVRRILRPGLALRPGSRRGGLGPRDPAQSCRALHARAVSTHGAAGVRRPLDALRAGGSSCLIACTGGRPPERLPERPDTPTVMKPAKLLRSDLPFRLISGGWGRSMSLMGTRRQQEHVSLSLQCRSLELSGQAVNQFSSHYC